MKSTNLILLAALLLLVFSGCSEENGSLTKPSTVIEASELIYADLGTTFEVSHDGCEECDEWKVLCIINEYSVELLEYNIEFIDCWDPVYNIECTTIQTWRYLAKEIGYVTIVFDRLVDTNHHRRIVLIRIKPPS